MKYILLKFLKTVTFEYVTKKSVNSQAVPPNISSITDHKIQLLEELFNCYYNIFHFKFVEMLKALLGMSQFVLSGTQLLL